MSKITRKGKKTHCLSGQRPKAISLLIARTPARIGELQELAKGWFGGQRRVLGRGGKRNQGREVLPRSASPNHPVSKKLKRAFEFRWAKAVLGLPLAGTTLLGSVVAPLPTWGDFSSGNEVNAEVVNEITLAEEELTTKETIKWPVEEVVISQGYHRWHQAIDLRAGWGSSVWAIDGGVITEVHYWQWGYGNYLVIDHGNGRQSLYAHLSAIEAKLGETVENGQEIGRVGSTGWSTGSHLHLEIVENGQRVNPRAVLGI